MEQEYKQQLNTNFGHGLTWDQKHKRWILRLEDGALWIMDTGTLVEVLKIGLK